MNYKNLQKNSVSIYLTLIVVFCAANIFGQKAQRNANFVNPCNPNAQGSGEGNGLAIDSSYSSETKIKADSDNYPGAIRPLRIISKPMPRYSDKARQNCVEGTIKLKVTFFANGSVGRIKVLKGLGCGLSNKAVEAAKLIKFEPQIKNNKAVTVTKKVTYNFTIY